jgi:hypothetical protein
MPAKRSHAPVLFGSAFINPQFLMASYQGGNLILSPLQGERDRVRGEKY